MQLFMVYLGGHIKNANIELHDMRFVIGQRIEDCYSDLIKQWWGDEGKCHLDAWGAVKSADGYRVLVKDTPPNHPEKLYFVNLGGYDPQEFTELHKNILVVAKSDAEAKARAKLQIQHWLKPHRDRLFEIEKILELNHIDGHFIHLEPTDNPEKFEFTCDYRPIGLD